MLRQSSGLKWIDQSQGHITTDGRPVSPSWCGAPSGTHEQILIAYFAVVAQQRVYMPQYFMAVGVEIYDETRLL
jgi:hypothetical protein